MSCGVSTRVSGLATPAEESDKGKENFEEGKKEKGRSHLIGNRLQPNHGAVYRFGDTTNVESKSRVRVRTD